MSQFIQCMFVFINSTCATLLLAREEGRESLTCFTPQNAAFGVLLRALWPFLLLALACVVLAAASHCSHRPSGICWQAAVCGGLQSVLLFIVQCWTLLSTCVLCAAKHACTMGEA